ncbi:HAMP domain-containing protein [Massilia sp. S19_KUP03_FR1]|uniref:HAMP domain-containing protein n=1 Tax=Massilia sp. S19_KUP03_FR1 TaxID=3025503 RepID=UPI002FCDB11D
MLSRLRLGSKLLLAPLLVLVVMLFVSCAAYRAIAREAEALAAVVQQRAAQTRSAAELAATARQAHAEVYQLITWIGASFSQARTDTLVRGIHRRHAAIARSFTALTRLTAEIGPEAALVHQAEIAYRSYLASVLDVIALARNDQSISANAMTRSQRAFDTVLLRLDALTRLEQLLGERAAAEAADESRTIATLMPAALMAALALALIVALALRSALQDELDALVAAANALGDGDLRPRAPLRGRDEICSAALALAAAREKLSARLQDVLEGARAVAASSGADNARLHEDALALARSVMAFQLDDSVVTPMAAPWPRTKKGTPEPFRRGRPYLRLAVSRR